MISPSEIDSIEEIGELSGAPIRLIRTIGGLVLATGRLSARDSQDSILASGSHRGIVKFSLEKKFAGKAAFNLMKNHAVESPVLDHSESLPPLLKAKGYELLTTRGAAGIVVYLNKDGRDVSQYVALHKGEEFFMQEPIFSRIAEAKVAQALGITRPVIEAIVKDAKRLDGKRVHLGTIKEGKATLSIEIG